jgi:hypothetical protein
LSSLLTHPDQATPAWTTEALRRSGALPQGRVLAIEARVETSYTATLAWLSLRYSKEATPAAPRRLLLKLSRSGSEQRVVGNEQRRREVTFHTEVAAAMDEPPVVRCHWAVYSQETGATLLLFDDVSSTHLSVGPTQAPALWQAESAMDALAQLHALWWDHPGLGKIGSLPSRDSVAEDVANARSHWRPFYPLIKERLTASQSGLYAAVLEQMPGLWQRLLTGSGLTLIHGDAHMANVMLPRTPADGRALIIDWQLWGISFGAMDLAHMMALGWTRETRQKIEERLVRRYYRTLSERGVTGYAWSDCWNDYRLAVLLRVLFMPMWFWHAGQTEAVWQGCLVRALDAAEDLECATLLGT